MGLSPASHSPPQHPQRGQDPRGHIPSLSSAEWLHIFSWAGARRGDGDVGTEASPAAKTSQELQHLTRPSQSGFLPPDSRPRTEAAGTRLCREGSHVSPRRESLIHAKSYPSLALGRGICPFSLTPRLFSSLPVLNPFRAHHA